MMKTKQNQSGILLLATSRTNKRKVVKETTVNKQALKYKRTDEHVNKQTDKWMTRQTDTHKNLIYNTIQTASCGHIKKDSWSLKFHKFYCISISTYHEQISKSIPDVAIYSRG